MLCYSKLPKGCWENFTIKIIYNENISFSSTEIKEQCDTLEFELLKMSQNELQNLKSNWNTRLSSTDVGL